MRLKVAPEVREEFSYMEVWTMISKNWLWVVIACMVIVTVARRRVR